jgi:D-amino peptidase
MKLYVSADIEGVVGISHWDQANINNPAYSHFRKQMQLEVNTVCESALKAGAKEIWVRDAHGSGRNLFVNELPKNCKLISNKNDNPFRMMQELDSSFDGVLFVGYHSGGNFDSNPLAHTFTRDLSYIKINGEYASEFLINTFLCSYVNVPVLFISGDDGICTQAKKFIPDISTVSTFVGEGNSLISRLPKDVINEMTTRVSDIVSKRNFNNQIIKLPQNFDIEIGYVSHVKAYKASFYPNVKKIGAKSISFTTKDYYEFLRMLVFIV